MNEFLNQNHIPLAAAHAALDAVGVAQGSNPAASLLDQAEGYQPQPSGVGAVPEAPPSGGSSSSQPVMSGVQSVEASLLSVVRVKLNRVANEFGIPYDHVRDFFVSHL